MNSAKNIADVHEAVQNKKALWPEANVFFPQMTLSVEDREKICRRCPELPSPFDDYSSFAPQALSIACGNLPSEVLLAVKKLRDVDRAPGALLLRNLWDDDDLPDTPFEGHAVGKKPFSEVYIVGLGSLLGALIGYGEKDSFIQEITPRPDQKHSVSSEGSALDFCCHVDYAAVQPRPDFMLLACLRADHCRYAKSTLVASKDLCKYLDQESLAVLRTPVFKHRSPGDFAVGQEAWWSEPAPILTGPPAYPEFALNVATVQPLTPRAQRALEAVRELMQLSDIGHTFCLDPGDVLVLNNRKVMHARSAFPATFDGQERWLQRLYVQADPWPWRTQPGVMPRVFA